MKGLFLIITTLLKNPQAYPTSLVFNALTTVFFIVQVSMEKNEGTKD